MKRRTRQIVMLLVVLMVIGTVYASIVYNEPAGTTTSKALPGSIPTAEKSTPDPDPLKKISAPGPWGAKKAKSPGSPPDDQLLYDDDIDLATTWISWQKCGADDKDGVPTACDDGPCAMPNNQMWTYGRLFSPEKISDRIRLTRAQRDYLLPGGSDDAIKTVFASRTKAFFATWGTPDRYLKNYYGNGFFCYYTRDKADPPQRPIFTTGDRPHRIAPDFPQLYGMATPAEIEAFTHQVRMHLHDQGLRHMGVHEDLPVGKKQVQVAVLDSSYPNVTCNGCPGYYRSELQHGVDMGLLVRELACGNGVTDLLNDCPVQLTNHMVTPLQNRRIAGDTVELNENTDTGGFVGELHTLTTQLVIAAVMRDVFFKDDPFVINLSIGWENNEISSRHAMIDGRRVNHLPPAHSVLAALKYLRCNGALIFASAGNKSFGPTDKPVSEGPLAPGAWESFSAASDIDWSDLGANECRLPLTDKPLLYSVWGVNGMRKPISVTREGGKSKLAAYAYQFPSNEQFLMDTLEPPGPDNFTRRNAITGSSVATAVATGISAYLWSHLPGKSADDIAKILYNSAVALSITEADYCYQPGSDPCEGPRQLSLCEAAKLAGIDGTAAIDCPEFLPENVTWHDDHYDDAEMLSTSTNYNDKKGQYCSECATGPGTEPNVFFKDVPGAPPFDPSRCTCSERKYYSAMTGPWFKPQPPRPGCSGCNASSNPGLYLYLDNLQPNLEPADVLSLAVKITLTLASGEQTVTYYDLNDYKDALFDYRDPGRQPIWIKDFAEKILPPGEFECDSVELVAEMLDYSGESFSESIQILCNLYHLP